MTEEKTERGCDLVRRKRYKNTIACLVGGMVVVVGVWTVLTRPRYVNDDRCSTSDNDSSHLTPVYCSSQSQPKLQVSGMSQGFQYFLIVGSQQQYLITSGGVDSQILTRLRTQAHLAVMVGDCNY